MNQNDLDEWFIHGRKGKVVPAPPITAAPMAMGAPTFRGGSPPVHPQSQLPAGHREIDVPGFKNIVSVQTNPGGGTCGFYVTAAMYGITSAWDMRVALADHFRNAPPAMKLVYARAMPAVTLRKPGPTDTLAAAENFSHARNHQDCLICSGPCGATEAEFAMGPVPLLPSIDMLKYNEYIGKVVMRCQMDNLMWQACRNMFPKMRVAFVTRVKEGGAYHLQRYRAMEFRGEDADFWVQEGIIKPSDFSMLEEFDRVVLFTPPTLTKIGDRVLKEGNDGHFELVHPVKAALPPPGSPPQRLAGSPRTPPSPTAPKARGRARSSSHSSATTNRDSCGITLASADSFFEYSGDEADRAAYLTAKMRYPCVVCKKTFRTKGSLYTHRRTELHYRGAYSENEEKSGASAEESAEEEAENDESEPASDGMESEEKSNTSEEESAEEAKLPLPAAPPPALAVPVAAVQKPAAAVPQNAFAMMMNTSKQQQPASKQQQPAKARSAVSAIKNPEELKGDALKAFNMIPTRAVRRENYSEADKQRCAFA